MSEAGLVENIIDDSWARYVDIGEDLDRFLKSQYPAHLVRVEVFDDFGMINTAHAVPLTGMIKHRNDRWMVWLPKKLSEVCRNRCIS